ncbi:MAG: hypothetical protein HDS68_01860 [Bacteroidales bacterium]|nr:hypothetical protein [Bacteroidales bacterium]
MWRRGITVIVTLLMAVGCLQGLELPEKSWVIPDVSERSMREHLKETRLNASEGIWSSTDDGARVAIVAGTPPGSKRRLSESYLIVILDSPRPGIRPGTVAGVCAPAARPDTYDCMMYTANDGRILSKPQRFTLQMADRSHLTMTEVHSGVRVVFGYSLPRINFLRLTTRNDRPADLDGFLRIWPAEGPPSLPRRL